VVIGDSRLPPGPLSGGSQATASLVPAVTQATNAAIMQMLSAAAQADRSPFAGQTPQTLSFDAAMVYRKGTSPGAGVPFEWILAVAQVNAVMGRGKSGSSADDADAKTISIHSYCAHFVEVTWQPETARLGAQPDRGAIVMGVGMALFEQTHYDARSGAPLNRNLADYVMTTHADSPKIDVTFLDYPDFALNTLGARGLVRSDWRVSPRQSRAPFIMRRAFGSGICRCRLRIFWNRKRTHKN
jgi:xanthine dehydrogenase YagR molybdenum-binding subunit